MMSQLDTPVLLIAFNRPVETRRVIDRIAEVRPVRLYVAMDGPRRGRPGDAENCQAVREIITSRINWPCEVRTLFRDENLGCRRAVSSALDWFFADVEEGIVVEDDVLPSISFFPFCEELLRKYRADERVGMISGDNFGLGYRRTPESYFFTQYTHVWGWASWRRAWAGYDVDVPDYRAFRAQGWLQDLFPDHRESEFWQANFDRVAFDNFDTWDFQFAYHNLKNGRVNIMPAVNLVRNIGFNSSATHTTGESLYGNLETLEMDFPLVHPEFVVIDQRSSEMSRRSFLPKEESASDGTSAPGYRNRMRTLLRKVKGVLSI